VGVSSNLNRIASSALWSVISLCLIGFGSVACAQAAGVARTTANEATPLISQATNGAPVVSAALKSIQNLKSYRFRAAIRTVKDGKVKESGGTFFFKSPNLLRVEIEGHGPKAGSKLVRNAKGTIRFKGGPSLLGITINIEPDSRLLKLPSGRSVTESDFGSLLQGLSTDIAAGLKVTASPSAISLDDEPGKAIILEVQEPGQNVHLVSQRIYIDPKNNVPLRWVRFKNGKLFTAAKFEDVQINPDIGDDMFNL
jgi:outer membrane lipoprotein-sorting protein